jgi:LacI family gluconate utilization system Gnt-I transcriptional repressor
MDSRSPVVEQAVGFDNAAASYAMTELMLQKGYRRIVYLGARMDVRTRLKMEGYAAAMQAHGLEPLTMTTDAASSFSLGAKLLSEARMRYPDMDGVICTNDDLAVGAIFECQRQNIAVPAEIGVAGFHGHDIGQAMVPKLASVITPREAIGRVAAEQLLARINGVALTEPVIDLGFELSAGQSI